MIPLRIQLSGFLSYKEAQSIDFREAPIWMLSGDNGSGKSAVFDGIAYALFGGHRGGTSNAGELINKDSTAFAVEFECRIDGRDYLIKRTLRKNAKGATSPTQQVLAKGPDGSWAAVPDTTKKTDFDKWIHDKVGLDHKTFTSSVLLMQGQSEKLLNADPKERHLVLAGIVNLEKYQNLHERANLKKLEFKAQQTTLANQFAGVPEVSDEQFSLALIRIDESETARRLAQEKINACLNLELQAKQWAEAHAKAVAAREKLKEAEGLLGAAAKIEKAFARHEELKDVLPAVNAVVTERTRISESVRKVERLIKDREEAQTLKKKAEADLETAKKTKTNQQEQLRKDETIFAGVTARLRELAAELTTVEAVEKQELEKQKLDKELAKIPADAEEKAKNTQETLEKLQDLGRVVPQLEKFHAERIDLAAAKKKLAEATKLRDKIRADGEKAKAACEAAKPELDAARAAKAKAENELAVAKANEVQTRTALKNFETTKGATACSHCGSPLTAKHFKEEKERRETAIQLSVDQLQKAETVAAECAEREKEADRKDAEATAKRDDLRTKYADQGNEVKLATANFDHLTKSLGIRYTEMSEPYRTRIAKTAPAEWEGTEYPTAADVALLKTEAAQLDVVRKILKEANAAVEKLKVLRTQVASAQKTLDQMKLSLPETTASVLRKEHAQLDAQEKAVGETIKAAKKALLATDREIDRLGSEAHAASQHLTEIRSKLDSEAGIQKHSIEIVDRTLTQIPQAWREPASKAGLKEFSLWKHEQDGLIAEDTETKYQQLGVARLRLATFKDECAVAEEADSAFPAEARVPAEVAKQQTVAARVVLSTCEEAFQAAQKEKLRLDGIREQRAKLSEDAKRVNLLHERYKLLSDLLGKDRLQRHLLAQAEKMIVDCANSALDRLSNGGLFLRLVSGEGDAPGEKALDMECLVRTGDSEKLIHVAFLSGSQRFRVAVSLALGIGRYASRGQRPIESVIIDEGFGCLDRYGRQTMIQEMQNLKGQLSRILLVSHQEEFADAFPDGYHFELVNGATHVERVRK